MKYSQHLSKCRIMLLSFLPILILSIWPVSAEEVTCTLTVENYRIVTREKGHEIFVDGFGSLAVPGEPKLPGKIFAVAIPPHTRMTAVTVRPEETVIVDGFYSLASRPSVRPLLNEDETARARRDKTWQTSHDAVYGCDDLYPAEAGRAVRAAAYRKYNLVDVAVTPFGYRPLSGQLVFYPRVTIEVTCAPMVSGYDLPLIDHHPVTEKIAEDMILNYEEAQAWYPAGEAGKDREVLDYVIIMPAALTDSVASLVAWEETKGRHCAVVTLEWIDSQYSGVDLAEKVRNFLREKYPTSQWGIRDVLLVGNHGEIPLRVGWVDVGYGRPKTDFYYAELSLPDDQSWDLNSDGCYGEPGVDQIDFYPEVNIGRIPWAEGAVVEHICQKSEAFEKNHDPAFKKNILCLGAFWYADLGATIMMEVKTGVPWMSGWTKTYMYEKNVDFYDTYPCDLELLRGHVVNQWSRGKFAFVNWGGHGSGVSCHILGLGAPAFIKAADCPSLNDDYPAVVCAVACYQNNPDYDNIGRRMLRLGAVGFLGATQVALGAGGWDEPTDGSGQSLDYYFTANVTSGDYAIGAAHQQAMRTIYTSGGWNDAHFETYIWNLWGNPDLWLLCDGEPDAIPLITAPGPAEHNTADVRIFDIRQGDTLMDEFKAYQADKFGANVAAGDIASDLDDEIVTAPGPGRIFASHIRGFKMNGQPIGGVNYFAYGTKKFGANVACGDVDGDGFAEILTGAGPGAVFGPHVRGWNYDDDAITPLQDINFFAYGTRKFGSNLACGDVDGDGYEEILTGAGPGYIFGPHVRGWNYDGQALTAMTSVNFMAYGLKHYGVRVGAGDFAGDGRDEILTGPGPGANLASHVRGFSCESGRAQMISGVNFIAYPEYRYGVAVTAGRADGESKDEIITGPGPGFENSAHVRAWEFTGGSVIASAGRDFLAFSEPDYRCGVNVAIGR